jgi:hypothetical protein
VLRNPVLQISHGSRWSPAEPTSAHSFLSRIRSALAAELDGVRRSVMATAALSWGCRGLPVVGSRRQRLQTFYHAQPASELAEAAPRFGDLGMPGLLAHHGRGRRRSQRAPDFSCWSRPPCLRTANSSCRGGRRGAQVGAGVPQRFILIITSGPHQGEGCRRPTICRS